MRRAFTVLLAGVVMLAGLAGCGRLRDRAADSDLSWPGQALQAVGFSADDLAAADSVVDSDPGAGRGRHPRLRYAFQHALHGEATVQTEDGTRTVVAQRGTVTALAGTTVTVTSADGFTLTWAVPADAVVVVDRARSQLSALAEGTEVGVAGSRTGDIVSARLLVVPKG